MYVAGIITPRKPTIVMKIPQPVRSCPNLLLTSVDDNDRRADIARVGTEALNFLDDDKGVSVGDLTKDNVVAIQPGGIDSGDEELRAVAMGLLVNAKYERACFRFGGERTCCDQRWPWIGGRAWCACRGSSRR